MIPHDDTLSLTLPVASRSRVRIRRPKRPSSWAIFWALYAGWMFWLTVNNYIHHEWVSFALGAAFTVLYATAAWHHWHHRSGEAHRLFRSVYRWYVLVPLFSFWILAIVFLHA
jgi:hypothetical protein